MVKTLIKKLSAGIAAFTLVFPFSAAQAATNWDASANRLIDNVMTAKSVDFVADVSVEAGSANLARPITGLVSVTGLANETSGAFTMFASSTDASGKTSETRGALTVVPGALYFTQDGGAWYVVNTSDLTKQVPTVEDVSADASNVKSAMQDLFAHGVIEYSYKGISMVNFIPAVRYSYSVNMDRLVDYVAQKNSLTDADTAKVREYFVNHVTVSGNLWVDAGRMLPVKMTTSIAVDFNESSYVTVNASVLFKGFNVPVNITAPKDAVPFDDAHMQSTESSTENHFESLVGPMDTDNDGVTNADEMNIWHSNPFNADTDGDGYPDKTEIVNGYNPNAVGKLDSDNDGLSDYAELTVYKTNRYNADTDGDGYKDGVEVANGYNPNGIGR